MAEAASALVITGIGLTVNVSVWLAVPYALLAESVIVIVPAGVGLPEITPVSESRLKPAGRSVAAKLVGVWVAAIV